MRPSSKKATKHLLGSAFAEALSSIEENKLENLQKLLFRFDALYNMISERTTLLIRAIERGNMLAVNILLEFESIDTGGEFKRRTALDMAARKNMPDLVWRLYALNPKGKPFLSAIEGGHATLAEMLMKRIYSSPEEAARDHRGDYSMAIHLAGSVECLKLVLPYSDVNAVSIMYGTPLQAAISLKNFEVAEYLVDHVPQVDFEPEVWRTSIVLHSPLILAMKSERRSLVEKLLKSGKCQRTLDSIVNFPTPDELLELYDRHWLHDEDMNPTEITRTQEITYVPPQVSKEEYLSRIFKLLNVPESERVISYTERDYHLKKKSKETNFFFLYEYNLEDCPIELMKEFVKKQKDLSPISEDISKEEVVAIVKNIIRGNERNASIYPKYQRYHSAPDPSAVKILRRNLELEPNQRDFFSVTNFFGYFERDDIHYYMKLNVVSQNGSSEFADRKFLGIDEVHRSHVYNQVPLYTQTNYLQLLSMYGEAPQGSQYRFLVDTIVNSFCTKQIVEKVEEGVELIREHLGENTNGRVFANNGCVYVFVTRRMMSRLDKLICLVDPTSTKEDQSTNVESEWPLPRLPYQFFLGEFKSNPEAEMAKDRAIIEGIWWESTCEKYSEADVLNEQNFGVRGKWKIYSAATDEDKDAIKDEIRNHNANVQH